MDEAARTPSLLKPSPGWEIVLGSASPRRRAMLERLGLPLTLAHAEIEETVRPGEAPETAALRIARAKVEAVAAALPPPQPALPQRAVLAADTLVAVTLEDRGDLPLGKPRDAAEAKTMLALLSGHEHRVITAYFLMHQGKDRITGQPASRMAASGLVASRVRFRPLRLEAIEAYLRTGEPMDKAGGYALQGLAAAFIERVEGSLTNGIGLPLDEVVQSLVELGAVAWNT